MDSMVHTAACERFENVTLHSGVESVFGRTCSCLLQNELRLGAGINRAVMDFNLESGIKIATLIPAVILNGCGGPWVGSQTFIGVR